MTSHPDWNAHTGATEVARVYKEGIRGGVFVVTGVSPNSLGEALALSLASQSPALLILVSRTQSKLNAIVSSIYKTYPDLKPGVVKTVLCNLSDFENVREAAGKIRALVVGWAKGKIDVLFNNAGANLTTRKLNKQGVEMQFATNHLGPFLLTTLLSNYGLFKPQGHGNGESVVVMTSSDAHRISPVRFSDYNQTPGAKIEEEDKPRRGMPKMVVRGDGGYEMMVAYAQSKTANVLMAVGLNGRGVRSFAVMPGTIMTNMPSDMDQKALDAITAAVSFWKNIDQGAATMMVAAFDPLLQPENGVYLDDCQVRRPSKWAMDPVKAERLWKLSEELVGEKFGGKGSKL